MVKDGRTSELGETARVLGSGLRGRFRRPRSGQRPLRPAEPTEQVSVGRETAIFAL